MKKAQSPERMPAQSPEMKQAQSPEQMPAQSPELMPAQSPERKQALNMEKPVHSCHDKTDNLIQKEKLKSKYKKLHSSDLLMNRSVNSPDSFSLYSAIPLESASNSWNDLNVMVFGNVYHQLFMTIPVDTQDTPGLPTLHSVLQSAFLSASSCLLTIGAICSAEFRKNGSYTYFDSHSHGENGLSSSDGASCLITFSNLDGLVLYLYAFYDSMKLDTTDTNLQYDFLLFNVKKSEEEQSYKDRMESHMEAYLNDQKLGQANKTQKYMRIMSNKLSSISVNE